MSFCSLCKRLGLFSLFMPLVLAGCARPTRVQDFPVKVDASKDYIDAKPREIAIRGVVGKGPYYSRPEKYPGKIIQARLKKMRVSDPDSDLVCAYGSRIVPRSDGRKCEVWCSFCGPEGTRTVGAFWLYVRYEEP